MKILLSGVPGGGKTWTGNELEDRYGFAHLDMEYDFFRPARDFLRDPDRFWRDINLHHDDRDVVMGWGFHPFASLTAIKGIVQRGFVPVWFDGNRAHFYSTFMRRECGNPAKELDFYQQMAGIIQTRVEEAIPWLRFNPYGEDGKFERDNTDRLLNLVRQGGAPVL